MCQGGNEVESDDQEKFLIILIDLIALKKFQAPNPKIGYWELVIF